MTETGDYTAFLIFFRLTVDSKKLFLTLIFTKRKIYKFLKYDKNLEEFQKYLAKMQSMNTFLLLLLCTVNAE